MQIKQLPDPVYFYLFFLLQMKVFYTKSLFKSKCYVLLLILYAYYRNKNYLYIVLNIQVVSNEKLIFTTALN